MNKTRIICTAGPAIASEKKFLQLAQNGMNIVRFNCSHGTAQDRERFLSLITKTEKITKRPLGIMIDLQGPRLRVGDLPKPFTLVAGDVWHLAVKKKADEKSKTLPIDLASLHNNLNPHTDIFMDDGLIHVRVIKKTPAGADVAVVVGGTLTSRKGVNIPHIKGTLPILSQKDKEDLLWGLNHDVNFVAMSFVRTSDDVLKLKALIRKHKTYQPPLVISKIEKPEAMQNLRAIVKESDGIIVARGDLGIELGLAKVPAAQNRIVSVCRDLKKPVIVATQMLSSMRWEAIPTRAEVSDVATAVYLGADGVMLTGETSVGKHAVAAVKMLGQIISQTEQVPLSVPTPAPAYDKDTLAETILANVCQLAKDVRAKAIVVHTTRGQMTGILSKLGVAIPIFACTENEHLYRRTTLFSGIIPIMVDKRMSCGQGNDIIAHLKALKYLRTNDLVVFVERVAKTNSVNVEITAI
ncbi:MAG: hypothetical protein ACD_62C00164G0006 [uncultured bacterium]|nr:MAG: hypothetical protein ACD_62C00164G0006 [uncultured bacterium]